MAARGFFESAMAPITEIRSFCQKQPPEVFSKKRCYQKFRKIHRKNTCVRGSFLIKAERLGFFLNKVKIMAPFFNKVRAATLLKKGLWQRCFPMNFSKNTVFREHLWATVSVLSNVKSKLWHH